VGSLYTVVLIFAVANADAPIPENPYLTQAKLLYQSAEFEKCLQKIDQARRLRDPGKDLADVELYEGLCHFNLDREAEARSHFEKALIANPALQAPAFSSPKITAALEESRAKLPQIPSEKSNDLVPSQPASANEWEPGRGKWLQYARPASATLTVLAAIGATVAGISAARNEQFANRAAFTSDAAMYVDRSRRAAELSNIAWGATAVSAAIAAFCWTWSAESR
jgi:hypothetical protein